MIEEIKNIYHSTNDETEFVNSMIENKYALSYAEARRIYTVLKTKKVKPMKENKIYVILTTPLNEYIDRTLLENCENKVYNSIDEIREYFTDCAIMELSEFMDAYNNDEIYQENTFFGYVQVKGE